MSGFDKRWSEEDIDLLRFLRSELGVSHPAIGKLLGRSERAVSCQCHKLDIWPPGGGPSVVHPHTTPQAIFFRATDLAYQIASAQKEAHRMPPLDKGRSLEW